MIVCGRAEMAVPTMPISPLCICLCPTPLSSLHASSLVSLPLTKCTPAPSPTFPLRISHLYCGVSLLVRALASPGQAADDSDKDTLVTEFMRYVNATQQAWPLEGRRPTALMPPSTVVKVQMDSLMRNDWPEEDSGLRTAFTFSMPTGAEEMLAGQVPQSLSSARAWDAAERYLTFPEFCSLLREPMYAPVINCTKWEVASPVIFHGPGDRRAVQCVNVTFDTVEGGEICRAYTFCLQKVQQGAYKNCWMVVGVRLGDYANV